jgi:hypothetical protein
VTQGEGTEFKPQYCKKKKKKKMKRRSDLEEKKTLEGMRGFTNTLNE